MGDVNKGDKKGPCAADGPLNDAWFKLSLANCPRKTSVSQSTILNYEIARWGFRLEEKNWLIEQTKWA